MLRVRIFAAGAVLLIAAGSAVAQANGTAQSNGAPGAPGAPLPILKIDREMGKQTGKAKAKVHAALHGKTAARPAKFASHRKAASKLAAARHKNHAATAGKRAAEKRVAEKQDRPAPASAPSASLAAAPPAPTVPAASAAAAAPGAQPILHDLAVESQTVPLPFPNDAAAATPTAAAAVNPPNTVGNPAATAPAQRIAQAFVAAPPPRSRIGSAAWIAQVFAALGGAVAAGSVAWFLIGPALPLKTES